MVATKLKQGLRRSLQSLLATACALGALEFGLRAAGFEYPPADDPVVIWNRAEDRELRVGKGLHRSAARQLWEPRPGAPIPAAWSPSAERVNAAGYRGPERPRAKRSGVLRVATLGDSSTFGYGVEYGSTYSARLEALLAEGGAQSEVLDFGVVGFTLLQGIERYRLVVRDYRPDVVVAAFGSINDHHLAQGAGDAEKIARSEDVAGPLVACARRLRLESRAVHAAAKGLAALRGTDPAAAERASAEAAELDALRPHVGEIDLEERLHGRRRVALDEFRAGLAELERLVREDGASLVLVSLPRRPGVEFNSPVLRLYSQVLDAHARSGGCLYYDGRGDFRAYREIEHGDPHLFFLDGDDVHPSKRGHLRLARGLFAVVAGLRPKR